MAEQLFLYGVYSITSALSNSTAHAGTRNTKSAIATSGEIVDDRGRR